MLPTNRPTRSFLLVAAAILLGALVWTFADPEWGAGPVAEREDADPGQKLAEEDVEEAAAQRRGAWVDQIVFTREADVGRATGLLNTGDHQVYTDGITSTSVFRRLRDSERTAHELSYGSSVELTLNPAGPHFEDGRLNPFHVPAIREALNRLVNRRYIAEEIYGGLAVPRFLPISTAFPDYARLADVARELELRYQHDPEAAGEAIARAMKELGATRRDGRWTYDGEPVELIVLIRTEDERQRVGDYVANLLEDLGFRVQRRYRTAEEASRIWIARPPSAGGWHIYTGGWISPAINRDEAQAFADYYTPRGRADPLWQAYEPSEEFDEVAERLQRRDYATREERRELMARGLELSLENSARIWLVDQLNVWAHGRDVELSVDLAGGVSGSALWPYTVRYRDRVGGSMRFGAPNILTEPWNPVAGSNWIFDQMITRATRDWAVLPDPFTGLAQPQRIERAEVTVREDAPVSRSLEWLSLERAEAIQVPDDAWIDWDGEARRFINVGEKHEDGLTARARVRVHFEEDYFERRWHDGSQTSLADIVLPWILTFERADEDSDLFDPAHVPDFEAFQRHFRGWRIVSEDPLVLDVYSDQIFPDAETLVAQRTPSAIPWHVLALGIEAERRGRLAFSSNQADRMQVEWMSWVSGPSLPVLDDILDDALSDARIPYPETLDRWISGEDAEARYRAARSWRDDRGHYWIGDGPFYLHAVHPVEGSLVLRRFEAFPDAAEKWLRYTRPEIPELTLDGPLVIDAGEDATFRLDITFEGEPVDPETIVQAQYLLFDGDSELIRKGEAEVTEDGSWRVSLPRETLEALGTGANSLEVAVTSTRVALPAFASHGFATVPAGASTPGWIEEELEEAGRWRR